MTLIISDYAVETGNPSGSGSITDDERMSDENDHAMWVDRLLDAAQRGVALDLQAGAPASQYNPATANEWAADRSIPASAIRTAMITVMRGEHSDLDLRGLRVQGARITGPVDFAHIDFSYPLHFVRCRIDQPVDLRNATLGTLVLSKSHIRSLSLDAATVAGDVDARHLTTDGEFSVFCAAIGGTLDLRDSYLRGYGQNALILSSATITGSVAAQRITTLGEIRAAGATIGGQLILNDAYLHNPEQHVLALDGATITGSVVAQRITAHGEIRAAGATIGGQLVLRDSYLHNRQQTALLLEGTTITGSVVAQRITAHGEIRLRDASIGGQLILNDAYLHNPTRHVLALDGATITGDVFAQRITAHGEIRALSTTIGGQLILNDAYLHNPTQNAFSLDCATIRGSVFADRITAYGEIRALSTNFDGQLNLNGASLHNPEQKALTLESATILGDMSTVGLRTHGIVSAVNVRIEGNLDFADISPRLPQDPYLLVLLQDSVIHRLALPRNSLSGVDLSGSKIAHLVTPQSSEPRYPVVATGWDLGDVEGLIRTDHKAATRWIATAERGERASPQPWHALAAVYDRNGHPAEARRLRFTAANKVTKTAPPTTKVARWGYLLGAGHGYYPLVAAFWILMALIGGVTLVNMNKEHFVPTTISAATTFTTSAADAPKDTTLITGADACSTHPQYPCLDSFSYALTGVIPAATGITRPDWAVSSAAPIWVKLGLPALRTLAWIFTAILLAGVTGLLRKSS